MMKSGVMRNLLVVLFVLFAFASCEKAFIKEKKTENARVVFDEIWKVLDKGYGNFIYKGLSWDTTYMAYDTLVNDTMDTYELFDMATRLIAELKDPDITLDAGFTQWSYNNQLNAAANYNEKVVQQNYLKKYERSGPFIYSIFLPDSIAYVQYSSFNDNLDEYKLEEFIKNLKRLGGTKGTILDLRNNRGGNMDNLFMLIKHIDVPDTMGAGTNYLFLTAYRNGPKHGDFTKYFDNWVDESGGERLPVKMAVLVNRACFGVTSMFTTGCKALPLVKIFGDSTSGGGGHIMGAELPNGWRLRYPNSIVLDINDNNITDGVAPDSLLITTPADEAAGKDLLMEAALDYIRP
jgi:Periplasmic protease